MATKIKSQTTEKVKKQKAEKLNCPVCMSKIVLKIDKTSKIIVCSTCDNSLFLHKTKKKTILQPFALNLGIEGNRLVPEEEFDDLDEGFEDSFDPEDFDEEDD